MRVSGAGRGQRESNSDSAFRDSPGGGWRSVSPVDPYLTYNTDMTRGSRKKRPRGRVVSASDAAKNFGALVNRVREERATYVVERAGIPVVQIVPVDARQARVADLITALRSGPKPDKAYLRDVERGVAFLNKPALPGDPWAS